MRRALAAGLAWAVLACDGEPAGPDPRPPEIESSAVAANPTNVLSAVVSATVRRADSVVARYASIGSSLELSTPATVPDAGPVLLPVLGLRPETEYVLRVVAFGSRTVTSDALWFTTGSLPDDLPAYHAEGPDPSPGYVVLADGPYGLVIDNQGRVVWYHRFSHGPGLNFQAQPNGRFVARPPPGDAATVQPWIEIDPLGRTTRTLGCAGGLQPRFHDLIALPDGSYWVLCDRIRTVDLSHLGGHPRMRVIGTEIQHVGPGGALLFTWSPFDHFEIDRIDPDQVRDSTFNWTHGNALDLDVDGHLLVSFRNLSEITRIDTRTGRVRWRMGGRHSQFAFSNTSPPFARQHGIRVTASGRLVLLDNLGDPAGSRAERYSYDPIAGTARLEASYGPATPVVAELGGTTQPLPGGRTLVSFGSGGRVQEYDAAGHPVWWIDSPGYAFRAQRIRSLYSPGMVLPR